MIDFPREVRHAARRLRRSAAFTATTLVVLALGIGATTAVFSIVDGVLLRPLPYAQSDRLMDLSHSIQVSGVVTVDQSDASFLLYQRHNTVFTGIGAYRDIGVNLARASSDAARSERVVATTVSASLFPTLQVAPVLGRGFRDGEDRVGAPLVAVIAYGTWRQTFGGDPAIIGKQLLVDGVSREIVGVMPGSFQFPTPATRVWLPIAFDAQHSQPGSFNYKAVARLAPGVTERAAATQLDGILPRLLDEFPSNIPKAMFAQAHLHPVVKPLRDVMVGDVSRLLWILFGTAALLLVIACANVANLFLVRTEGRQRELAVRGALGGTRTALLVQIGSEAVLLAIAGGAVGVLLAAIAVHLLGNLPASLDLPRLTEITISPAVIAFAFAATLATAAAVSLVPVLRTGRIPISAVLKESGRSNTGGVDRQRTRGMLVVAQVALALVLVAASGLMARSFARLREVQPGFRATGLFAMKVALPSVSYGTTASRMQLYDRISTAADALPGVRSVALTTWRPLSGDNDDGVVFVEDHPLPPDAVPRVHDRAEVTGNYFSTMGIPLLFGRTFGTQDPARAVLEAVVSRAFAQRYWPHGSPLGKRIRPDIVGPWYTIIGEVGDVHMASLNQPAEDIVYYPMVTPDDSMHTSAPVNVSIIVRTAGDPDAAAGPVRHIVSGLDPSLPTYDEHSMAAVIANASAETRVTMLLLALASALALTLGAVGIYGVMMYGVSLRQREIGVRLALGAQPTDVSRMISMQGVRLAAAGVVIGLVGALIVTRFLHGLLFGVSPTDPLTLGGTCVVLLLVALLASWLPARRAAGVDPAEALRRD